MHDSDASAHGIVYLVGAGPGDPGLLTVKGMQLLYSADVVVYDRLVNERLVAGLPDRIEIIDGGKVPGEGRRRQEQINDVLVELAARGKRIVRLKGGDPFVFGRGGEEALALVQAGVPFEIVPGVTSAVGAPAYAGIPLTHRGLASSVTVVTGSESPDKIDGDVPWSALAKADGTLVILMGWENLRSIVAALTRGGLSEDTPVALIQWGTELHQQTVVGDLSNIVAKAKSADLSPPVAIVIGKVVGLRERLRWFDNRPLFGKRVLVTRTRAQASALSDLLREEGARPVELPTIQIELLPDYAELDSALGDLSRYDWAVFTSANAVEVVFDRLAELARDSRSFGGVRVAVIGSATAHALRERGINADHIAREFVSESIVEGLEQQGVAGSKVFLPKPETGRDVVSRGLEKLGASVHDVVAYKTVTPPDSAAHLLQVLSEGVDVATFTSSSTVKNLAAMLDGDISRLGEARIACIGPVTAASAREVGLDVDILAAEHTIGGLVTALRDYFASTESSASE